MSHRDFRGSRWQISVENHVTSGSKEAIGYSFYKNVGCYALRKEALNFYLATKPGNIERAEGIELLRLIENHKRIFTVQIDSESMAVDTEKDLQRIRAEFKKRKWIV